MPEKTTRRILLVDDDLAVLLSLKAVLEISGFAVDSASSATEARSRLKFSQYHMVITDMKMEEDRSGFQVIKEARESDYDPAIAILTAHSVEGSKWREAGANCLLVKPIDTEVLLRQIEALLVQHEDRKRRRGSSNAVESDLVSGEHAA
jgi:DNA-binding response OmpR family regulator